MRNHRIVTLLSAAAITAASGLAVAPSAHAEGAIVKLVSAESGKCLQPVNGSLTQGQAIVQQTCNGSVAQQWTVATVSSTKVHLVNRSSGLCLDARGGAVNGTPIQHHQQLVVVGSLQHLQPLRRDTGTAGRPGDGVAVLRRRPCAALEPPQRMSLLAGRPARVLLALAAMAFELLTLAWIRRWFSGTGFLRSFISITLGGVIIATIGAALGAVN
jgi:hypothetical protein